MGWGQGRETKEGIGEGGCRLKKQVKYYFVLIKPNAVPAWQNINENKTFAGLRKLLTSC